MHPELLQRAGPVLSFLYKQGHLDSQHLELLWGTILHKHEAVRAALLKTLGEIVQDFSTADLQTQFERVKDLELGDFDADVFHLLKTLCKTGIRVAYGLEIVRTPLMRRRLGIMETQRAKQVKTADD